jgi:hypothetical protein
MLISHNVDWNLSTMVDRGPADGCGNFASRAAHPRIVLGVKLLLRGKVRWTNSDVETISPKAINAFRTLSRTRHARPSLPYVPVRRLYSFGRAGGWPTRWLRCSASTTSTLAPSRFAFGDSSTSRVGHRMLPRIGQR